MPGSDMRATPPWTRMSAGTRSSAITAHAPAASAIRACSASTTSMITPPLSISARPVFTRIVPYSAMTPVYRGRSGPLRAETADGGVQLRLARGDGPDEDRVALRAHHILDVALVDPGRVLLERLLLARDTRGVARERDRQDVAARRGRPQTAV